MSAYTDDIKIDLSEFGEGWYAVIRNPKAVLSKRDVLPVLVDKEPETEAELHAFLDMNQGKVRSVLAKLIVDWRVLDIQTGEPLPLPKADPSALDENRCPEFALDEMFREVKRVMDPLLQRGRQATETAPVDVPAEAPAST